MDIDLLSKMVKELILDNDKVCLPGLGCFVAEVVPSVFSDRGYTINPPYRRLSFRTNVPEDGLLADFYAKANGIESSVADQILRDFISELKSILTVRKNVVFPGLGRMRATRENNFFFVADEDLEIFPEGFALEPVSLKTHQASREDLVSAAGELKPMIDAASASSADSDAPVDSASSADSDAPVDSASSADSAAPADSAVSADSAAPAVSAGSDLEDDASAVSGSDSEAPAEDAGASGDRAAVSEDEPEIFRDNSESAVSEDNPGTSEDSSAPVADNKKHGAGRIVLTAAGIAAGIAVLLLVVYLLLAYLCPDFINSILYDAEELEVLKYGWQ